MVSFYIAAIGVLMLASAVWRYLQRDMVGAIACLLMAVLAIVVMLLPA
ncbi:hypothetical protein [Mesorhizobium sp.]|nr:hypothetical protein [Mesorhizobium sp.]